MIMDFHSGSNSCNNSNSTSTRDSTTSTYHYSSDFTFNNSSSSSSDDDSDTYDTNDDNNSGLLDGDHDHDHDHDNYYMSNSSSSNNSNDNATGSNNNVGLGKRKRTLVMLRHRRYDYEEEEDARHAGGNSGSGRRVRHRGAHRGGGGGGLGMCDHHHILSSSRRRKQEGNKKDRYNNNNNYNNINRNDDETKWYCSTLCRRLSRNKKTNKKKKNKNKNKKTLLLSSYINPQIVFLILAGIGWTIIQLDLPVMIPSTYRNTNNVNTVVQPLSSSSSSTTTSSSYDVVHNTRYLRYHPKPATTSDASATLKIQQDELEKDKRHKAFLLRRQRLQNEINTTLFSVDDFVRISTLLLLSPTSTSTMTLDDNSTATSTTLKSTSSSSKSKAAMDEIDPDLKPVLRILQNAGYKFLDYDTLRILPTWTDIVGMYGQEPKIYGLETCQNYRDTVPWELRSLGPAGTFNTGTNLLSTLVASNCQMDPPPGRRIARFLWQSPWGKHIPSQFVHNHTHTPKLGMKVSKYNNTLAVVTTRDPLTWIVSMCDQNYAARYVHSKELCPNLVPYESDLQQYQFKTPDHQHDPHRPVKLKYTPVAVKYSDEIIARHRSMADMWNDFYGDYVSLPIDDGIEQSNDINIDTNNINEKDTKKRPSLPGRIIVRLEDLIFHADKVVPQICECMGATYHPDGTDGNILLIPETVNQNDGVQDLDSTITGILRTIIKYGTPSKRLERFQDMQQLVAAKKLLNGTLMDLFGYPPVPDIPSLKSVVS